MSNTLFLESKMTEKIAELKNQLKNLPHPFTEEEKEIQSRIEILEDFQLMKMKLQIKIIIKLRFLDCNNILETVFQESTCRQCNSSKLNIIEVALPENSGPEL